MAIAAATSWEVRPATGSDTNGGGYSSGGSDYSQQDSPQHSVTDGVTNGTTTITSATANFGTGVVGNVVYVQGGTGSVTAGWYQVASRTNATTIVVDRATGLTAGTGVTLKLGGALASVGMACGASGGASGATAAAGNVIYLKGTNTVTSTSNNVSGGRFTLPATSTSRNGCLIGYTTTRGDGGQATVIADGVITSFTLCTAAFISNIYNIIFDGNSRTGSTGLSCGTNSTFAYNCQFKNFTTAGMTATNAASQAVECYATGNSGPSFNCSTKWCVASANSSTPFTGAGNGIAHDNSYALNNTGASTDGFAPGSAFAYLSGIVSVGNGRDGVRFSSGNPGCAENGISYGNTGNGYISAGTINFPMLINCAAGGNGTNFDSSVSTGQINSITLSANPFVNSGSGNYALNNTTGGGASLRALAYPATLPGISTTANYTDIGAAQAQAQAVAGGRVQSLTRGLVD